MNICCPFKDAFIKAIFDAIFDANYVAISFAIFVPVKLDQISDMCETLAISWRQIASKSH